MESLPFLWPCSSNSTSNLLCQTRPLLKIWRWKETHTRAFTISAQTRIGPKFSVEIAGYGLSLFFVVVANPSAMEFTGQRTDQKTTRSKALQMLRIDETSPMWEANNNSVHRITTLDLRDPQANKTLEEVVSSFILLLGQSIFRISSLGKLTKLIFLYIDYAQ